MRSYRIRAVIAALVLAAPLVPLAAQATAPTGSAPLDSLVVQALAVSPAIHAAAKSLKTKA